MIPGDFRPPRFDRRKAILLGLSGLLGLGLLVAVAFILTFIISAWLGRPVVFGYNEGPDQPIAFPHTVHVQQLQLDCTFCHRQVTTERNAGIPALGLCMTCHSVVGDDKPEITQKLRPFYQEGKAVDWVRVHRLPDHVKFVHEAHVRFFSQRDGVAPSQVCSICHGDVGSMVKVRQVRSLKMGDCVDCHRENNAPTDCVVCHY